MHIDRAALAGSPMKLQRWRHLRNTAITLFEQRGFVDVSIDDIAEAAAISRRTYFNYFATKAAVLFDPDPQEASRLSGLLHEADPTDELWSTLTWALAVYFADQGAVVGARRSILAADPSLDQLHMLANAQFERAILEWLAESSLDDFRAHLISAIALAVVREAFRTWDPASGYDTFLALLAEGFTLAESGVIERVPRPDARGSGIADR